jgi:type I restriction enzyme R subunit
VWARESWLEILGRYLIAKRDKKKQIERSSSRASISSM